MSLLKQEMLKKLNELLQSMFDANAVADNVVYNLENNFCLNQASDIVHHRYAHIYPVWADRAQKIILVRDGRANREGLKDHTEDYSTITECFNALVEANLNIEDKFVEVIDLAEDIGDIYVKIAAEGLYEKFGGMTKQSIVWKRKAEYSKDDYNKFDDLFSGTLVIDEGGEFIG